MYVGPSYTVHNELKDVKVVIMETVHNKLKDVKVVTMETEVMRTHKNKIHLKLMSSFYQSVYAECVCKLFKPKLFDFSVC